MNSYTNTLLYFAKCNEAESDEYKEWNKHSNKMVRHVKNEHVTIIDSHEVERLVETLDNYNCLQIHGCQVISFKLSDHFV